MLKCFRTHGKWKEHNCRQPPPTNNKSVYIYYIKVFSLVKTTLLAVRALEFQVLMPHTHYTVYINTVVSLLENNKWIVNCTSETPSEARGQRPPADISPPKWVSTWIIARQTKTDLIALLIRTLCLLTLIKNCVFIYWVIHGLFLLNRNNYWRCIFPFYPRDAMLARVIGIAMCLSVRPSVRHTPVLFQKEES